MYEHTIGVPLILRGPGLPRGVANPAPCHLRDLFPTVCEMCGIPIPANVEGRSLVAAWQGAANDRQPFTIGYFQDSQRMIRTARWKLTWYPKQNREQLFDLTNDPDELCDRVDDPAVQDERAALRRQLLDWLRAHDDPAVHQPRP